MNKRMYRRQFLQAAGAVAVAGSTLHLSGTRVNAPAPASTSSPRLLVGCCAISYNDALRHGGMTLDQFIRNAVELRLDGVDMTAYYFNSTAPAYLASLRQLAYRNAVAFSGVSCGASLVQADPGKRAATLQEIKHWVDVADQLGAPHLRIFAGKLPAGATLAEATGWVVEGMKAACDYAGPKGIMIGIEDHLGVTQRADVCLEIMHRVNSPWAGINLDITHFIPTATQDAYAQIEACIPYATNTHIRDHFDDRTPIDMDRVWQMFARAGFKGFMSIEYERHGPSGEDASTAVPKLVAKVRTLCQRYSSI